MNKIHTHIYTSNGNIIRTKLKQCAERNRVNEKHRQQSRKKRKCSKNAIEHQFICRTLEIVILCRKLPHSMSLFFMDVIFF